MTIVEITTYTEIRNPVLRQRAKMTCGRRERQILAKIGAIEAGYLSYDDLPEIKTGVIYDLLVLTSFRCKGIGSALIQCAEMLAIALGRHRIRVQPKAFDSSVDQDWLESWYRKHGYQECDCDCELEKTLAV